MKFENHVITISIEKNTSVEEILNSFHLSKKQRYSLFVNRQVSVNDRILSQSIPLQTNDVLQIFVSQEEDTIKAWHHPINIVYEDDIVLVVEKESGILVHSDGINETHTLCNLVQAYYQQTKQKHLVRPIHRLDVDTSGLVLFCKEPFFQPLLDYQLSCKQIHREYEAICQGIMEKSFYDIQKGIARDRHNAKKMRIDPRGKTARTQVTRIQTYQQVTLVHCRLFTGRTHQIRVHLASIQYPIVSDPLYGQKNPRIKRCALHACSLSFPHPITNKQIHCTCEMPQDMKNLLK